MEAFRWPGERPASLRRCVATLGVFDGVHVGHQRILAEVTAAARRLGIPAVVITFDRHPRRVLEGLPEPAITSLKHRLRLFEGLGVDWCAIIGFTAEVARMEAPEFARAVFVDLLGAELLVVGPDCRFGRDRRGDVDLCRRMGLEARVVPPVRVNGETVSSTAIRRAIRGAELARAELLLGRRFSLFGTVVGGSGRGGTIGIPTANLDVHNELIPQEGVYATWALCGEERAPSVTSVGTRQTFAPAPDAPPVVEVHVLDRELDLYGRDMEVQFVELLRPQAAFPSAEALAAQIRADIARARQVLSPSG